MGLDMYLFGVKEESNLHNYNICGTQIEIGYWRKANQIHNWFVENVQNGIDNGATYYVSKENLKALKKICEKVIIEPKRARELLPVSYGFFFGNNEYDDQYFYNIQKTIDICRYALEKDFDYFVYQGSW